MRKYIDRLNESQEEKSKSNNILIAKASNLALQSEQLRCEQDIALYENNLENEKNSKLFNVKNIYAINNKLTILKRELAYYNELAKELF